MPEFFRIDEFAKTADGSITVRDRVRLSCIGFDLAPVTIGDVLRFTAESQTGTRLTGEGVTGTRLTGDALATHG